MNSMDSQILSVHSILHLIFHRNKNQHRRAKWWKWLSILKRATADLAQSGVESQSQSQSQYLAHIIPRCYIAFSTVVADNQFSTLGIVLLAALARFSKITGMTQEMKKPSAVGKAKKTSPLVVKEDLGERIRRVEDAPTRSVQNSQPGDQTVPEKKPMEKSQSAKRGTKTKKKKNAIDDLFSGLF